MATRTPAAGGRRRQVLDAALTVLGTAGARGLTHQAVDRAAQVPPGTASNCFRSRDALVTGVVAHLEALDRQDWENLQHAELPGMARELAVLLGRMVHTATTGPGRVRTVARYALLVEGAARADVREPLARSRTALITWAADWLRHLGSAAPGQHCRMLFDYLDGLMLHRALVPLPEEDTTDPAPEIETFLAALLP
ncbi:TetR/AcrR family transcriptional regulator [Streptomyces sp. HNM0574]|uniref:TetR/AcrR family transcriptional regulator n=1 Tax=Streptomyces sp. HNM0574 TaxID=2714954 RepID=UPI00146C420C|nr:TetR/AcrR family transcriptional regulator [Streptomyces sp. HNM0574]NLU69550.1 TetR family transcriptional regulator [Streptomyces sp. HNM0574]